MTDERYVYMQDLKEKNSVKSGARHKRSGKRSHYVGLPSDHLTTAEKKRRNGPVESVKLNAPMTYDELKKLTPTLQFLYLDHCVNEHKARRVDLVSMLGVSQSGWNKFAKKLPGNLIFKGRYRTPHPEWLEFISPKPAPESPAPAPTAVEPIVLDKPVLIAKPEVNPYLVTLALKGTPSQLADLIAVLTDNSTDYDFTVTIRGVGKEDE